MRILLNLNEYYKGLELDQVNEIWSKMLDMKPNVEGLEYLYENRGTEEAKTERFRDAKAIGEASFHYQLVSLDKYMRSLNKESIFGTETIEKFDDEVFSRMIERYRFLMTEPKASMESETEM